MISKTISLSLARLSDYLELTKPRLVSLTLWSTAAGVILAKRGPVDFHLLLLTLLGSALVAGGSMSLNEWMERHEDALMSRTANRPLPAGKLNPKEAFFLGVFLTIFGIGILFFGVNKTAAAFSLLTFITYILIYTPLKKKTSWCTLVGAIPGALPPLIGWAAVHPQLGIQAWSLFAIIFFWQMPHFYAISWFCRKDYAAAGFRMLSVEDPGGKRIARGIVFYNLIMLPVSLLPTWTGLTGSFYFWSALCMGGVLTFLSLKCLKNLEQYARLFFRASLIYLTLLFVFMVLNKQ